MSCFQTEKLRKHSLCVLFSDSLYVESWCSAQSWCSAAVVQAFFEKGPTHTHTPTPTLPFFLSVQYEGSLPHTVKWLRLLLLLFYNSSSAHHCQHLGSDAHCGRLKGVQVVRTNVRHITAHHITSRDILDQRLQGQRATHLHVHTRRHHTHDSANDAQGAARGR